MTILDRPNRDLLVETIDRYLNDDLSAFEFDEAIFDIRDQTADETIKRVVDVLWSFYDDCDDHQVVLDRSSWNYFQRLRLLLKSDASLEASTRRIWSIAQAIAATAIVGFLWAAYKTGLGQHLLIVAIPFGLVSIGLSKWRVRLYRNACNIDLTMHPFTSVAQLLWIGRDLAYFRKQKYPPHLASRRIRSEASALANAFLSYAPWLICSPIALLFQMLPISIPVRRVVH